MWLLIYIWVSVLLVPLPGAAKYAVHPAKPDQPGMPAMGARIIQTVQSRAVAKAGSTLLALNMLILPGDKGARRER